MKWLLDLLMTVCRAILSDTRQRRQWMFITTLAVLGFIFGGYFLCLDFLERHPILFALYLLISFAGLIFVMLFALFDLFSVRKAYAEQKKVALENITRGLSHDHDDTKEE